MVNKRDIIDLTMSSPDRLRSSNTHSPIANERNVIDLTMSSSESTGIEINHEQNTPGYPQDISDERTGLRRKGLKTVLADRGTQRSATQPRERSAQEEQVPTAKNDKKPLANGTRIRQRPVHASPQEQNCRSSPDSCLPDLPPGDDMKDIFFIDVQPAPVLSTEGSIPSVIVDNPTPPLLLPAHVSIFGNEPVEILPPDLGPPGEEEYIDYLDLDDRRDATNIARYFDDQSEHTAKKPSRTICKNCGAEGEHRTVSCPVIICLTCGLRNEHSTRSCPISKICFMCGMKGHINATCPNRNTARPNAFNNCDVCDRCGSELHKANECPTLWRLYEYANQEVKDGTLRRRRERQHLMLGRGGEGYIADDEWCYNCGHSGHWGDDCKDIPHQRDLPDEPSAFSCHNTLSGPYAGVAERISSNSRRREPRDWEQTTSWSNRVPEFVGRQGRRNHMARMERRALELAGEPDVDDWFDNPRNARSRGTRRISEDKGPSNLRFGKSLKENGKKHPRPSQPPSLLERMSDDHHCVNPRSRLYERNFDSQRSHGHDEHHSRLNDRYSRYPDRNGEEYRRRKEAGPRYKGGYLR